MEIGPGQPTLYTEDMPKRMLSFFKDWPEYRCVKKQVASGGRKVEIEETTPNTPPTLNKFAISIGVHRNTLKNWSLEHPEFLCAYEICRAIQEEFTSDKGLLGEYNQGITKLMLVNHTSIQDKVVHEVKAGGISLNVTPDESGL